jgi:ABC-type uncharacterized transport system permease subunit
MTFIIIQSLIFIIPLLLVALGGMFAEKSGTINIALEGMMVIGAFCGIIFISKMQAAGNLSGHPQLLLVIALLLAALGGMLFSALLGFLAINMKANQTIGGTALNLLAAAVAIYGARATSETGGSQIQFAPVFELKSSFLADSVPWLNYIFFDKVYLTTYLGIILWILSVVIIYKTRFGLRMSACGEHPEAAQSVGVNVYRYRWAGILISGALGGLGGLTYVITTSVSFDGDVAGYGFLALAVLIFGQWRPGRIMLAAVFFGFFKALASTYFGINFIKDLMNAYPGFPYGMVFRILPYAMTMLVLAFSSKKSRAPKAEGIPFDFKAR